MDPQWKDLADRSPNFGFLAQHEPLLALYGAGAEAYVFSDPNAALFRTRQFIQTLTGTLLRQVGVTVSGNKLVDHIAALANTGALTPEIQGAFNRVRIIGNKAVHDDLYDSQRALGNLRTCYELGIWYHRALTGNRTVAAFVPPEPPKTVNPDEHAKLRAEVDRYRRELAETKVNLADGHTSAQALAEARDQAEQKLARVAAERDRLSALVRNFEADQPALQDAYDARMAEPATISTAAREAFIERARRPAPLTEAQVREKVDRMLADAGWTVQDMAGLNPAASLGVAVREFPLGRGFADYALYVGEKLVGVVEAKREGVVLSDAERQSDRYASAVLPADAPAMWRGPLPFRYESTAVETFFTNDLDPEPRAREVFSFHRPDTLARWMREADAASEPTRATLRGRLRRLPELNPDGLRAAQITAIEGLERSFAQDRPRALIQMATGAGKTFTAATVSHRLLKHAGAHRILFLVDRNTLGDQTLQEFRNYVTPDNRRFPELYNVERLTGRDVLASSKVVISTIQRMYALLRGEPITDDETEDAEADRETRGDPVDAVYNPTIPPETFDFIVVDECHRSIYGRWRSVLEYFDASITGLTATPVQQTFGFFHQNVVSEYLYQMAVADGVNVDFDVFRIRTDVTEHGATLDKGLLVPLRDRLTRRQRYEELEDDYTYTGTQLGNAVLSQDRIRTVIQTFSDKLFTEIFPGRREVPKTLIFARNDNHAEEIVRIVREVFGRGNEFAAKITYRSRRDGHNPDHLLQDFRNSPHLRIAVTVDMIATGTDVRPLECVFFLRDVKTPAYFEQMKGRGTRTIDPTEYQSVTPDARTKDRFVIVDAVGVTDNPLVDATPLQRQAERQISLDKLLRKTADRTITAEQVSTLASRLARLDNDIDDAERAELDQVAGQPLADVRRDMVAAVQPEELEHARAAGPDAVRELIGRAVTPLTTNPRLRDRILELRRAKDIVIDEVTEDRVSEAYGVPRAERARSKISSWADYLREHRDEILVQEIMYGRRGGRAVYAQCKEMAERIARPPYTWTPDTLWEAYEQVGKAAAKPGRTHGPMELVSLIRFELGMDTELTPYRSVIEERYTAWLRKQEQAGTRFSTEQRWWLDRIVDIIATDATFDDDVLDQKPFTDQGGTDGFLAAFGDAQAESLLTDLNEDLTA